MNQILKDICKKKEEQLEILKSKCSQKSLEKLLPSKTNRKFKSAIQLSQKNRKNNIIAEIKKSSPSAGVIIKDYKPDDIAIQYEKSGAGAISILTETFFFNGHIDHLSLINTKTNIPILRKDFIIDHYQIFESKVYKADAILLITTILDDFKIKEFINIANDIGLDCIVETHTPEEIKRAVNINYPLIGINNRNLDTLSIDTNNVTELIKDLTADFTIIGESGIKNKSVIELYNNFGIYNFLIGEALLKTNNIEVKIKEFLKK